MKTKSAQAFSLIETAIVLGVIGLVIGGIWVAAASVQENWRQTQAVTQVIQIISNMRRVFEGQPVSVGLNVQWDQNQNLIPSIYPPEMITANGRIHNPWGGDVTVGIDNSTGTKRLTLDYYIDRGEGTVRICATIAPRLFAALRRETQAGTD